MNINEMAHLFFQKKNFLRAKELKRAKQNLEPCINEIKNYLFQHQMQFSESKTQIFIIESKLNKICHKYIIQTFK